MPCRNTTAARAKPFQDILEFEMAKMIFFLDEKRACPGGVSKSQSVRGRDVMSLSTGRYQLTNAFKVRSKRNGKKRTMSGRDVVCKDFERGPHWDPLSIRLS